MEIKKKEIVALWILITSSETFGLVLLAVWNIWAKSWRAFSASLCDFWLVLNKLLCCEGRPLWTEDKRNRIAASVGDGWVAGGLRGSKGKRRVLAVEFNGGGGGGIGWGGLSDCQNCFNSSSRWRSSPVSFGPSIWFGGRQFLSGVENENLEGMKSEMLCVSNWLYFRCTCWLI